MNNVVLVGFMGSGKTTVGRELADRLRREFVDLDRDIEADAGRSVSEIFAGEGESAFREREARSLQRALEQERAVIAAGGGAPLREENWQRMRRGNTVVALMAEPAELARRLRNGDARPLLGSDPPSAIASLLPERMSRYLAADLVVRTDRQAPPEVAARIAQGLPQSGLERIPIAVPAGDNAVSFHEAVIGRRLAAVIASSVRRMQPAGPVLLVSDEHVAPLHAPGLQQVIGAFGLEAILHTVPAGEAAKDISVLAGIYDALGRAGVDRQGVIVILGGGTVGDVAGFAAGTWMRGIRYLQVPTTLLAMVDSSIGGKTAINLPVGKNMAGVVHQPSAVFCDLDYLETLPDREYRPALAEIIKAALIGDRDFADWLTQHLPALLGREPRVVLEAIGRAIAIKAGVVARDPLETGLRAILNYGHTVGHALERAAGYGRIHHGEAVAWGMEVAARISVLAQRCSGEVAAAQHRLLQSAQLLEHRPTVDRSALLDALGHDKKARSGEPRWVLLADIGRVVPGQRVDPAMVSRALDEVMSS